MGKLCAIVDCSKSTADGVTLFSISKGGTRETWLEFIRKANANYERWREIKCMYVCSEHFDDRFIRKGYLGGRSVAANGYPTLLNGQEVESNDETSTSKEFSPSNQEPSTTTFHFEVSEEVTIPVLTESPSVCVYSIGDDGNADKLDKETEMAYLQAALAQKERVISELTQKLSRSQNLVRIKTQTCRRLTEAKRKLKTELTSCKRRKLEESSVPNPTQDVLLELINRKTVPKTAPFSDVLRNFSYTLHYFSARAYEYVRDSLPFLPSIRSFHSWTAHIGTRPGFLQTSLQYIQMKSTESPDPIYYALSLDEMHIRKQILHRGDGFVGFIDYGNLAKVDVKVKGQVATTALFIMATEINGNKKVPIGYALTNGLKGDTLAELIKNSLAILSSTNVRVLSITFDGLPCNFKAVQLLGADLDIRSENFKPYILDTLGRRVFIILDPSHMMKLMRNMFNHYKVMLDQNNKEIRWDFIQVLNRLQEDEGLKAANKLSSRHVNFHNQKMKTKLCVQVLSNSVATALGVCRELGIKGFEQSKATEEFLSHCDKLFDLLNSRTKGTGFKAAFWPSNIVARMEFFVSCKNYFSQLKRLDGIPITDTPRGVAIKGLLITMRSVQLICEEVLLNQDEILRYLPLFKLSQDMIESFFSLIRSRGGFNNNPNVIQLESALKATLCMRTHSIKTGNCIEQEEMCVRISALSRLHTITDDTYEDMEPTYEEEENYDDMILEELSAFATNVVVYVAGWTVRKLCAKVPCAKCIMLLYMKDEDLPNLSENSLLLLTRDNGGLHHPSLETITVCTLTEQKIRKVQATGLHKMNKSVIVSSVVEECKKQRLQMECEDVLVNNDHPTSLIYAIAMQYISVRFHYMAKQSSLSINPITRRSSNTKSTLFGGN